MSSASAERHYGDETLVAYLDRELSEGDREAVAHHLGECWSCRTRAAEIEQDIHEVIRMIEAQSSGEGGEIQRALHRFHVRREEFESRRRPPRPGRWMLPRLSCRPIPLAVAGVALAGAGMAVLWLRAPQGFKPEVPEAIVAQASASEKEIGLARQPSHQVLRVQAQTSNGPAPRDLGALEIWSDPAAGGRYSSRWTDARNTLRHAVWKPAEATRYAYDPALQRAVPCGQPTRTTHLVDWLESSADLASLETAFLKWVRSRAWTVVSLAEEWAVFADQGGVRAVVERLRDGRRNLWRLSASRAGRDHGFEMILQVDAETYLPRVQAVRVSSGGRVAELRLTVQSWQSVGPHELQPAVFAPAASLLFPDRRPAPAAPTPLPFTPEKVSLPGWALADLELRVRLALHEALECVDVSVRRDPASGVAVRPLFSDAPHLAALERILEGIDGRNYVTIEPGQGSSDSRTSHASMIRKHARLLEEIAGSALHPSGLSPLQERQLARLFADHRRGLRLEMAHLEVQLRNSAQAAAGDARALPLPVGDVADFPFAPHFLGLEEVRALAARINGHAASLADGENTDPGSIARLTRVLTRLDGDLLSLENSMRAPGTQAAR